GKERFADGLLLDCADRTRLALRGRRHCGNCSGLPYDEGGGPRPIQSAQPVRNGNLSGLRYRPQRGGIGEDAAGKWTSDTSGGNRLPGVRSVYFAHDRFDHVSVVGFPSTTRERQMIRFLVFAK